MILYEKFSKLFFGIEYVVCTVLVLGTGGREVWDEKKGDKTSLHPPPAPTQSGFTFPREDRYVGK